MDGIASKAGYDKRTKVENQIDKLKQDRETALSKQASDITTAKQREYDALKGNFQSAANWTYGASLASNMKTGKTRLDDIIDYRLTTALSYGPGPTPAAIVEQNKLLREELDTAKLSNEALAKRYEDKEKEAQNARAAEAQRTKEVEALQTKRIETERLFAQGIEAKSNELNRVNGDLLTLKEAQLTNAKSTQAFKTKASAALGILALLCLAGTIWSPVFKSNLALAAAILGLASVSVWYIEGWMILVAVGLVFAAITVYVLRKHHIESKTATNVYRAVEAFKTEAKDQYDTLLKPKLSEWTSKYDKSGKLKPDEVAIKHIDERLRSVDAK